VKAFDFSRPDRLEDVLKALDPATRPYAGGTDLLPLMKADLLSPARLVDVKKALEAGIAAGEDGLTVGALAVLDDLEKDARIRSSYTALAEAAAAAASPQLRNMATIGGNLLQRPRCWYFRNPRVRCWLKGGERCAAEEGDNRHHALFGGGPCHAVHPSDPAAALVALNAEVRACGRGGERIVPAEDFFALPREGRRIETVLGEDELVVSLRLPPPAPGMRSTYLKAMERKAWTFALAGVAAALRLSEDGKVLDARVVLSGVAPIPWRAFRSEELLLNEKAGEKAFAAAARAAVEGASPLMHNGYKLPLVEALVRGALERVSL
jgi:xanthine dehydrogenase YagS FAD-binding subunit